MRVEIEEGYRSGGYKGQKNHTVRKQGGELLGRL
jgi:hypothetical protein